MKEGTEIVRLNLKEVDKQAQKWKSALIGYVLGGSPSFKDMLKFVYGVWKFINVPQVYLHDEGYFIVKFDNEDDKNKVIQQRPYTVQNRPMILKQWDPEFQMSKELTRNVLIWVIFPSLPIQYWSKENLGRIASCLGKPICSDKLTANCERVSYARILVDMYITQKLPDSLMIEVVDGKYREQMLEYEWKPIFCEECLQLEQHKEGCKKDQQAQRQKEQQITKPKQQQQKVKKPTGQWKVKVVEDKDQKEKEDKLKSKQGEGTKAEFSQQKNRGKQIIKEQGKPKQHEALSDKNFEELMQKNRFGPLRIQEICGTDKVTEGVVLDKDNPP